MYIGEKHASGRDTYDPKWRQFALTCVLAVVYLALGTIVGAVWIRTTAWFIFMAAQTVGLVVFFVVDFRDRRWKIEAFSSKRSEEGALLLGVQGPVEKMWFAMFQARSRADDQPGIR